MQVSQSYIRQSYALAWSFFSVNKKSSFYVMGVLFVLVLFSMVPVLGYLASVAMGIVFLSSQTYMAKAIFHAENDDEYEQIITNTQPAELMTQYIKVGIGADIGFVLIEIIAVLTVLFMITTVIGMEGINALVEGTLTPEESVQMFQSMGSLGMLLLVVLMFFGYIYPLVLGRVFQSEGLGEALRSMFLMFSPVLWKASFNGKYFFLVTMLHLSVIVLSVLMVISAATLILIPLGVFFLYLMVLYAASVAVLGNKVCFDYDESHVE